MNARAEPLVAGRLRSLRRGVDSIAGRLVLASGAFALLVAVAFALLVATVDELRAANAREARAKEVTVAVLALERLVADLDTGVRTYAVTSDPQFLGSFDAARAELPGELGSFRRLASADASTRRLARQIENGIRSYVDDFAIPLVDIARDAPGAATSEDAIQEDRERIGTIRGRFSRLRAIVNAESQASANAASDRAREAVAIGLGGFVLCATLVLLIGLYLVYSIGRPLRAAASGAARIAEGDFTQRLPEKGPGEVHELSRTFNRMAAELEKRQRELEEQNAQLRTSEQLKSELVSIVSHEVRTPLASVLGFTSLLLQRDVPAEERRRYLEIIDQQGKRLAALLDDFLDVQRIEEGRLELVHERVDVSALLREQVQLYEAQSTEHALALRLPASSLLVEGDGDRLAQVIGNLLSNAIKYSPTGGRIEVEGDRADGRVRLRVRDHGLGIPEGQHDRIFTKFFRGDAAASGIAGSGLGLAFARAVVEAHGGSIGFRSAAGRGSTFWVELPAAGASRRAGDHREGGET
ncbi:MAG: ATP-binding protein [Pseudomonadota bacterium]